MFVHKRFILITIWVLIKSLENVDKGARLSWVQWGRHSPVLPKGAVAGGESYVARRRVDMNSLPTLGLRHHVGHFDPREGLGRVLVIEGSGEVYLLLYTLYNRKLFYKKLRQY